MTQEIQDFVLDPTQPESKDGEFIYTVNLTAGTYFVVVQAGANLSTPR